MRKVLPLTILLIILSAFAYADLRDQLTHYYRFNQVNALTDLIGDMDFTYQYNFTGYINQVTNQTVKLGNGAWSTSAAVTCIPDTQIINTNSGTLNVWAYPDNMKTGGYNNRLLGTNDSAASDFLIILTGNTIDWGYRFMNADTLASDDSDQSADEWDMITFTWDSTIGFQKISCSRNYP